MEALQEVLTQIFNRDFIQGIISNPNKKEGILRIKVRPVQQKGELRFQFESFTKTQAFHENLSAMDACEKAIQSAAEFRQMQFMTKQLCLNVLVSKKGKITIQKKQQTSERKVDSLDHNRSKKYILKEGIPVPFLQDLGVMTEDGKVVKSCFDKFRQVNRFLEFVEDILPHFEKDRQITILDFGCGKSYLTFAMYYYLHDIKNYDIRIVGLDLKSEVITHCNQLADKYGYEKLSFLVGDIAEYEGVETVDMVVTLHACDTATDYALAKAVGWGARVILSVPCCQHELNAQISNDILAPIMSYGLLKERFAALLTDGMRAKYLEAAGYDTQVLEFIDMEHTAKNILLRAVKSKTGKKMSKEEVGQCAAFFNAAPTLGKLLTDNKRI